MNTSARKPEEWDLVIKPRDRWYQLDLGTIWEYKDLLFLLVRRDFISQYKQTVLGPIWLIIQPVLTTIIYSIIFGLIARIGTDQIPPLLFYLSGLTLWSYFSDCFIKTSNIFIANSSIFGKVYFPRLIVPLSVLVSNLIKLAIQLLLFLVVWFYYNFTNPSFHPNLIYIVFLPILIIMMAGLGLGFGILVSSLTTKYRDLTFLVGFGVQLLMYASPIVYPMSLVPEKYKIIVLLNPLTSIIEGFKFMFLGTGIWSWTSLLYSFSFMTILILFSLIVFKKVEKTFMDTV
ncbi:MAG: ABC transporter permease [Bacteroidetes bacterium]|nr:ABC transporter permease [Bacteroidota bacterium]